MADDFLDGIVDAGTAAAPAPVETPQAAPQGPAPETPPATSEGQPRAADGKFASKEVAPAPEATPQPQQPDPEKEPISRGEFKGMLEWREKAQKAEAKAQELERQLQQRQPQTDISSIQNDPAAIEQHIQGARTDAVFTFSEKVARKEHGAETVQSAMDWGLQRAQQNPAFAAEYMRQEHPIDWAVKQFKRDQILTQIGDDPDAFIEARIAARLSAQAGGASPSQAAQPSQAATPQPMAPAPAPVAPPRSLASAPAAGAATSVPTHAVAAVDAIFQ